MVADRWVPSRRSDTFDVALAAVSAAGAAISLRVASDPAFGSGDHDHPRVAGMVAVAALCGVLALRRRRPLACLLAGTAIFAFLRLADVPEVLVSSNTEFVLLYTAGAYGGRWRDLARGVTAVAVAALVTESLVAGRSPLAGPVSVGLYALLSTATNVVFLAAGWLLGDQVRTAREREAALAAQAVALEAAQEERAARAVVAERLRIARELHDVLAQHVSVMGVQAAAARRVLPTRPGEVPELLASIEAAGRDAVAELHRLLGLLRDPEGADDPGPRPTLAGVPALAGQLRDAGLDVRLDLDGVAGGAGAGGPDLPAGVELSAYRITQEALTNALKHGGPGTTASVELWRRPAALELIVRDDGRGSGPSPPARGRGHGLVGMRERVAVHGGELKVGRCAGGGFEVRAWFPLPGAPGAGS